MKLLVAQHVKIPVVRIDHIHVAATFHKLAATLPVRLHRRQLKPVSEPAAKRPRNLARPGHHDLAYSGVRTAAQAYEFTFVASGQSEPNGVPRPYHVRTARDYGLAPSPYGRDMKPMPFLAELPQFHAVNRRAFRNPDAPIICPSWRE